MALAALVAACGGGGAPGFETLPFSPTVRDVVTVAAPAALVAPGFADEAGGGLFALPDGGAVRLTLEGRTAALERHPGNAVQPGAAQALYPLGPHGALVQTAEGLFVAEGGWLLSTGWSTALSGAGVVATTRDGEGAVWLQLSTGLFRLEDGALGELKLGGASVTGVAAMTAAPSEHGLPGLWVVRDGRLTVAEQRSHDELEAREVALPEPSPIVSIAAVGPGAGAPGALFVLGERALWRLNGARGWARYEVGARRGLELRAAGRMLWARFDEGLYRYDADTDEWLEAAGQAGPLVAVDASGAAWLEAGAIAFERAPRLRGLDQGQRLYDTTARVTAAAPGATEVRFSIDGAAEVAAAAPHFSLGGLDAAGEPKAHSFAALLPGPHTLTATATFDGGATAVRRVHFELTPLVSGQLSYAADIAPVFAARCASCHTTGPGRDLSTYELWKQNAALIVAAVNELRMPADGPLDPQLQQRLQRWASGGQLP